MSSTPYPSLTLVGENFLDPTRVPQYFILIQYISSWLEYNLKYHKNKLHFNSFSLQKDKIHEL
jgi:hypothetical protein